jgi:hypothetical protein
MIYRASVIGKDFSDKINEIRQINFVNNLTRLITGTIVKKHSDFVILKCDFKEKKKIKNIIKTKFDNIGFVELAL